jgi:hypothetical protein
MGHVGVSEETSIISLSSNNWLVFVKEVLKLQMMELVTMQISPSLLGQGVLISIPF